MIRVASLLILVLSGAPAPAQDAPSEADLAALNEVISDVENRIARTSARRSDVETQLLETEKTVADLNQRITSLEQDIRDQEQHLAELDRRSVDLDARRQEQQVLIGQYVLSAYQAGREEYLKLLLNQESIDQSARAVKYYDYFNRARAEKITAYNATLEAVRRLQQEVSQTRSSLQANRSQLDNRLADLESGQVQRRELMDELDQVLASSGSELEKLEREREEMELLIEELNRSIANLSLGGQQQPFAELRGRLPWPVDGPLLNAFGARHDLGDLNWQGVTIAASAGADVHAIHHGRVVFADWFGSSGLLLIIDHGDGYMSLYAQNQVLYHDVGDWVTRGEIIAAAGNTGGRRETGVYFEIRQNGRSVDPVAWCLARN